MTTKPDYYAILRVDPTATRQQVSRAYRALMRTHHPDVDGGGPVRRDGQDAELLQIMQAFSVLRDPEQRATYDSARTQARHQNPAATAVPVRKARPRAASAGTPIRITPVRWESGPWA